MRKRNYRRELFEVILAAIEGAAEAVTENKALRKRRRLRRRRREAAPDTGDHMPLFDWVHIKCAPYPTEEIERHIQYGEDFETEDDEDGAGEYAGEPADTREPEPPFDDGSEPSDFRPVYREDADGDEHGDEYEDEDDDEDGGYEESTDELEAPPFVIPGVHPNHPVHAEISMLMPALEVVKGMVEETGFTPTRRSMEIGASVWTQFNALSKYKGDPQFDSILTYVRTSIKPYCFAALGKDTKETK